MAYNLQSNCNTLRSPKFLTAARNGIMKILQFDKIQAYVVWLLSLEYMYLQYKVQAVEVVVNICW
jgi:hypothetical protein